MTIYTNAAWREQVKLRVGRDVPYPLNGVTLAMQIRAKPETTTVVAELTSANGRITVIDAADGHFELYLPKSVTQSIAPGIYVFDVLRTDGAEPVFLFGGRIQVAKGVTR